MISGVVKYSYRTGGDAMRFIGWFTSPGIYVKSVSSCHKKKDKKITELFCFFIVAGSSKWLTQVHLVAEQNLTCCCHEKRGRDGGHQPAPALLRATPTSPGHNLLPPWLPDREYLMLSFPPFYAEPHTIYKDVWNEWTFVWGRMTCLTKGTFSQWLTIVQTHQVSNDATFSLSFTCHANRLDPSPSDNARRQITERACFSCTIKGLQCTQRHSKTSSSKFLSN